MLALAALAAPAMACLVPGIAMTAQERDCCRHMAGQCDSMGMPASHSCCKAQVRAPHLFLTVTSSPAKVRLSTPILFDAPVAQPDSWSGATAAKHPPPEALVHVSILRI
jgi:hypothetical protein